MAALYNFIKRALRLPADVILASSRSLPAHIDECLAKSPVLRQRVEDYLRDSGKLNGELMKGPGASRNAAELPSLSEIEGEVLALPYKFYLEEANRARMDVNDYFETVVGWSPVAPLLEKSLVPMLKPDSVVVEVGAGTGRWSLEILKHIPCGQLHLVDYCDWFVKFQSDYFRKDTRVVVHQTNGFTLPMKEGNWADICCSYGTFLVLKVGNTWRYAKEFYRILKPGGHFLIEYLDIETPEGWQWMVDQSGGDESAGCFVYYTPAIMKRLFEDAGLEVLRDEHVGEWYNGYHARWLYGRKPE